MIEMLNGMFDGVADDITDDAIDIAAGDDLDIFADDYLMSLIFT